MTNKPITDPTLKFQYQQIHQSRPYGRSGIHFLPEMALYFLAAVADNRIELHKPFRILDYGCGRSLALDALGHVLSENLKTLCDLQARDAGIMAMFAAITNSLNKWSTAPNIPPFSNSFIKLHKFDPSIPEHAAFPKVKMDFIVCTDVLEHIPLSSAQNSKQASGHATPLKNTVQRILVLCPNVYFNISCRKAKQILPNGENAHCVQASPRWWQDFLKSCAPKHTPQPVLSRDTTSCAFYYGKITPQLHIMQYALLEKFGAIDLIAQETGPLYYHKRAVQSRYINYWMHTDPGSWNRPSFRNLAATIMRPAPNPLPPKLNYQR